MKAPEKITGKGAESEQRIFKTGSGKTKSNAIEVPSISLPKGGGAIKGIDEKFSINAVNGTASLIISLPFSPTRGISPSLSLSYNSGSGDGIFGLGWNIALSSIKRKTDKELPQYLDSIDSDTFLFSEAEDLVPEFQKENGGAFSLDANGDYIINEKDSADGLYRIRFYRPRIEGLFARIERWREKTTGVIKWRVMTKQNVTTLYGWTGNSRLTDPMQSKKIFEWLPEFVFDDKGNSAHYVYRREDQIGFNASLLHNKNRLVGQTLTYTNLYLQKVLYGNKTPYKTFGDVFPTATDYLFSTVFDYGTFLETDSPEVMNDWDFRPDAFSDYRAGFEIRTTRLCKRVLLFHHFTAENEYDGLVRSLNFEYDTNLEDFTFLKAIRSHGYIKKADGTYSQKHMPPLVFEYQAHEWNNEVKIISTKALVHDPEGLDGQRYQFTDLFNEGLSGILSEQANGWYFKHNLGDGKFERAKLVTPKPSFSGLGSAMQLADLDADGGKQLVNFSNESSGFFELDDESEWHSYRPFKSLPNIDFGDPNTRMFDLNGDGKQELVITEENAFIWYASEGRDGFAQAKKTIKPFDEDDGPNIVFADSKQSIFLADMSGDGMTDIVRIRNGEICYWSNLGYGKFGSKVTLDSSPIFDQPDAFNPSYIRLADIDGSGTADIIYLGKNKFTCWKNLSGNRFGKKPFVIDKFPEINEQVNITVTDLLGNGVACIVWSSPLSKDAHAPLKYIDLMNSRKPHIMVSYKNNMGKETTLEYAPSTKFFIEDKLAGKPWVTKLHFPVHCISKTIVEDKISGYRFVSEYKYHHGYYDHPEREFRGFGMVEQVDAETFERWKKVDASNIVEEPLHQEPVVSKTWYHTGAFLGKNRILNQFKEDYWHAEMERQGFPIIHNEADLPDARLIVSPGLDASILNRISAHEWREALRACKGMALRSEVFAKDAIKFGNTAEATKKELTPFSVATHNCVIELLQPKGKNKHAVFVVKESEAISYGYERNPADPRIAHSLNIKLDVYGNVLESASVVYPRKAADVALPSETQLEQSKTNIIYSQNQFTNDVLSDDVHRLRLPSEVKTFELKGVSKPGLYYTPSDFENILFDDQSDVALYHEIEKPLQNGKAQRRLIEHIRSTYYSNNLTSALPLHQLESLALPFEGFQLAYTPDLITYIFGTKVTPALLTEGKFTNSEGDNNWWIRSGTTQFVQAQETSAVAQNRFNVPVSFTDPYGAITKVKYYGDYFLNIQETENALGNKATVDVFDFRTLAPQRMRDINNNISEAISDELGLVKATAILGRGNEADDLAGFSEITETAEITAIQNFFDAIDSVQLNTIGKSLLQHATTRFVYDFDAYINQGKPPRVASIIREEHFQKNNDSPIQISFEYSNGIGEVAMKKVQGEAGKAKQAIVNADNSITVNEVDTSASNPPQLRWIGNGRVVKNNKGSAVKQYEPYFSVNHHYEDNRELVEVGVTPILYYDAAGRLIKTEMPDGTFSKVEFDSWRQAVYDANDTILETDWYLNRTNRLIDAQLIADGKDPLREKQAADKAAKHAKTPGVTHFDTLGRAVLSVEHNKNVTTEVDEFYLTKVKLDAEGNLRSVTDARGNVVMQYKYDMLGNQVYQNSMDAGQRWLLTNIIGNPLCTWDERNHEFQYFYDLVQRPTYSKVLGGDGVSPLDNIFSRVIYGESLLLPDRSNEILLQGKNILGQAIQLYDTGGSIETLEYDFKGKPLATKRRLFAKYKEVSNWIDANLASDLEPESFTFTSDADALGRITRQVAPDGSIITPSYNEGGLLDSETVLHPQASMPTIYIKDIDYNEKGQRNKVIYGNDVFTKFYYDKETVRLKRLETKRQNNDRLQDLYYTFDPVGNITHIEDKNIPVTFFDNQKIAGVSEYTYDAAYRLVIATGRENDAALLFNNQDNWNDAPFMRQHSSGDFMAMRNYTQRYQYDSVGNILQMQHQSIENSWTRNYAYESINNRLISTQVGDQTYLYPHHAQHGFITVMPHLEEMGWNFNEELIRTIRQRRTDGGTAETTYYQYDGSGERIRKITENQADPGVTPAKKEERIYIAGYELYKKHSGTDAVLERTSLSLMDEGHRFVMVETRNDVDDGTEKQLVRYQLHNHLGSAAMELDGNAEIISYEEYHPYGTTAYQAKNASINSSAKRYRYTAMERDEETGLEYHSARYYLPWLGKWLSADPMALSDGVCVYQYSDSNPVNLVDISGGQATWAMFGGGYRQEWNNFKNAVSGYATGNYQALQKTVEAMPTEFEARASRTINEIKRNPKLLMFGMYAPAAVQINQKLDKVEKRAEELDSTFLAANEQLNPAYGIFEHGSKGIDLLRKGEWQAAGAEGFQTASSIMATVGLAETLGAFRGKSGVALSNPDRVGKMEVPKAPPDAVIRPGQMASSATFTLEQKALRFLYRLTGGKDTGKGPNKITGMRVPFSDFRSKDPVLRMLETVPQGNYLGPNGAILTEMPSVQQFANLTRIHKTEFALGYNPSTNQIKLFQLGSTTGYFRAPVLLAHTHPMRDIIPTVYPWAPSKTDVNTLNALGQQSSVIVMSSGEAFTFTW